ncbi:MAG: amino acid racemase [Cyanobacteria bacterium J06632_22]
MIKTVGIIGGIAPASTIEYYRKIIDAYLVGEATGHYPHIIINSIDMTKMLSLIGDGEWDTVARYLADEVNRLASAGVDFGVLASNTPHIVFDRVCELSLLPLISIVEATAQEVLAVGLDKVALFGTRFTMQGGFYRDVLLQHGIEVITPDAVDQDFIHKKYMEELVKGTILDDTRSGLITIIEKIRQQHDIQGVILGGTELPLILKPEYVASIHVFDTTEIHVASIMNRLLPTSNG